MSTAKVQTLQCIEVLMVYGPTNMLQRIALTGLLLVSALLGGCFTPTVPIPPPEPQKMFFALSADMPGTARFSYDSAPSYGSAVVYVFNRDKGVGVITTAEPDGRVRPSDPFSGDIGDDIVVSFELDGQLGTTCVELQPGPSSVANECSP